MRLSATLFLLISLAIHGQAAEMKIVFNGDNTKTTFVGAKPEGKHEGGFKSLSGVAVVDSANPATLKFQVDWDMSSIYTDNDMLTGHLKSPDFFDIRNYPKAKFVSTKVEQANDQYQITGQLTLLELQR